MKEYYRELYFKTVMVLLAAQQLQNFPIYLPQGFLVNVVAVIVVEVQKAV